MYTTGSIFFFLTLWRSCMALSTICSGSKIRFTCARGCSNDWNLLRCNSTLNSLVVFNPDGSCVAPIGPPNSAINDSNQLPPEILVAIIVPIAAVLLAGVIVGIILGRRKKNGQPLCCKDQDYSSSRSTKVDSIMLKAVSQTSTGDNVETDSPSPPLSKKPTSEADITQSISRILPKNMIITYSDLTFIRELGSGDFGKVYEGEWNKSKVAIKINTSNDLESFYKEAELMLNLRPHPNVVQTLGYCENEGNLVLVVEYCDGGSLDRMLFDTNTTLSRTDQLNLMLNIAKGVYHLHVNNVIHRDLAARNILLSHSVPKISDFGLSRRVKGVQEHSQTKSTLGPIRWMAPESLKDSIYNEKTDVWSFGVLCWEIIHHSEPHLEENPLEIGIKIRDSYVTPRISADCDQDIAKLLLECWNPKPEARPSMRTICDRLEKIM